MNRSTREFVFRILIFFPNVFLTFYILFYILKTA